MTGLAVSAFGVALTGMGIFMYKSPRAIEVIRRHPFSKWKWWWKLSELWVLGAVPEGLGLMLAGVAQFMHADVVSLFALFAATLLVLGLWLRRPDWAKPYWMR
jgi:hypothetical protein